VLVRESGEPVYEIEERQVNPRLTQCERHALALARLGWTPEETAILLEIEPDTASRAVQTAIVKLGADNLAGAIAAAREDGILR
jgi:hypothetical protein